MQFEKLTHKSQQALQAAQELASQQGNQELRPEHLFKALLQEPDGVIIPVLQKMGVVFISARTQAQHIFQTA